MARSTPDFPSRVLAIAVVIAVLLGLLIWFSSGLGTPAESPPAATDEELDPEAAPGTDPGDGPGPDATNPAGPATPDAEELPLEPAVTGGDQITLQLYFLDGSRRLSPLSRQVQAPARLADRAQLAIEQLIDAGEDPGRISPLPAGTVLRELWVSRESGTAFLDFNDDLPDLLGGGSLAEIHAVYSIVGTLTSTFPEIHQVQILLGGRPVDTLNGHLDLSEPLVPLSDWLY